MTGTCKFCGQTMLTNCTTQESADYEAEMNCKCQEGMNYRNTEDMKEAAKANINALFEDESDETVALMMHAVDVLAEGNIKSVSFKLDERTKGTLILTTDEGIKIKKNYKEDYELKANKL